MNLILFLLLGLTASWTGLVQCEDNEETEQDPILETSEVGEEENSENQGDGAGSGDGAGAGHGRSQDFDSPPDIDSNTEQTDTNEETKTNTEANTDADTDDLNPVMIVIPLVLTLVIIAVIVCVVMIYRRWSIKVGDTKEDPYLDHEDHEKVPMPMFDDDIPSVMEMEMEDLGNWMAKDGGKKVDTGQI